MGSTAPVLFDRGCPCARWSTRATATTGRTPWSIPGRFVSWVLIAAATSWTRSAQYRRAFPEGFVPVWSGALRRLRALARPAAGGGRAPAARGARVRPPFSARRPGKRGTTRTPARRPFERPRLLEQVRRAGDDLQPHLRRICAIASRFMPMTGTSSPPTISSVGARDARQRAARRGRAGRRGRPRRGRAPAVRRRHQRRSAAGARAEVAHGQAAGVRARPQPVEDAARPRARGRPMSKRRWPVASSLRSSSRGEEVDEQRGQAGVAQHPRHVAVARAVPAAARAVGEEDHARARPAGPRGRRPGAASPAGTVTARSPSGARASSRAGNAVFAPPAARSSWTSPSVVWEKSS